MKHLKEHLVGRTDMEKIIAWLVDASRDFQY